MRYSEMLRRVAPVRTDVSEECFASIIRLIRIGELGKLALNSNGSTLQYVPPKRRFSREPHGVTFQKMEFFKFYEDFQMRRDRVSLCPSYRPFGATVSLSLSLSLSISLKAIVVPISPP
jgi:hypothetical protein